MDLQQDIIDRIIEFISFRFDQEVDRWQVIAALALALLILIYSGYSFWRGWVARSVRVIAAESNQTNSDNTASGNAASGDSKTGDSAGNKGAAGTKWLFVYLCGAVEKPGVYRIGSGTRLNTVVAMAGGLTPAADGNAINMARKLADGERIYIPRTGERASGSGDAGSGLGQGLNSVDSADLSSDQNAPGRININTANTAALDTIPGIGPTLAARIIEYRQKHNGFNDVNQLSDVDGIGPKILAKIKPYVCVE